VIGWLYLIGIVISVMVLAKLVSYVANHGFED